LKASAI